MGKNKKKVLVAMSGGVDSSVAAALLQEQGFEAFGVTIDDIQLEKYYKDAANYACSGKGAAEDAAKICRHLGIEHHTVNFSDDFKKNVIDYFIEDYLAGNTPNPCVKCNPTIKWGELMKAADRFGADYLATGHYAQIKKINTDSGSRFILHKGFDKHKDQTYFLWRLSQEQLAKTIFPLGGFDKNTTREFAAKFNLSVKDKPESQEICFIADDDYRNFLRMAVPDIDSKVGKGDIVLKGEVIGRHDGYPFYTVGQRRGLGVSYKEPLYVKKIIAATNTIEVSTYDDILDSGLIADTVNLAKYDNLDEAKRFTVKIRYKHQGTSAICRTLTDGRLEVKFDEQIRAVTPGQSVVMYDGDDLIGGGIIRECY